MSNVAKLAWNEETTNALRAKADSIGGEISQADVANIASELAAEFNKETTARSIGSKLRKEGYEVQKASEVVRQTWDEAEEAELVAYLNANEGEKTFAEIAAAICGGKFTRQQVQGKVLHLELNRQVKPTPAKAAERKFTPEVEATIVNMVQSGAFLEDIAAAVDRTSRQIHGKCLSLLREERIASLPVQRDKKETKRADVLEGLDVENMTVAEIAASTQKTEKGVKSMLSRRGVNSKDYKGADKRAKLDEKAAAKAE